MAIDETLLSKGLMRKLNALLSAATSLKRSSQSGWSARADLQAKEKPDPMAMKIVGPPPTSIPGGRVIAAGGKIRLHRPPGEGACLGAN